MQDFPEQVTEARVPRASLVVGAGEVAGLRGKLWMGGANSLHGEPVEHTTLGGSWVVDCAGEMPMQYREVAGRWVACVFADLDGRPAGLERIVATAQEVAEALREEAEAAYVVCQYGMNRSGLVTGLVLRELGLSGAESVARIRERRPGALSNLAFLDLVRHYEPRR